LFELKRIATVLQIRFDITQATWLPPDVKQRLVRFVRTAISAWLLFQTFAVTSAGPYVQGPPHE
jgi:hypothetical protein